MADFLGGLLSGGGGLYDDLLTPQQQSQLSSRGLLSMAGAFADAAMPSRVPVPLGAAIGKAAAAMSGGRDEAALKLLQGQKLSQEVQTMKATAAIQQQMIDDMRKLPLDALIKAIHGPGGLPTAGPSVTPGAVPTAPAPPTTSPLPAAPAASGGLLDADLAGGYTGAMPAGAPPGYDADLSPIPSGVPPEKASSLRPPDTVLPSGPGGLLATPASYNGGGAAAGDQWLQQNAPFPTLQRPDTPPIQWTNDQPKVPFGQAPGDVMPGGGAASAPATNLDTVIPSGRGVPANMLQRVADKGGAPAAPGTPTVPVPPGVDPQAMNALLMELAKRNAMAEILKLGNPYGSMLSVLQGSPAYQGQIETAKRGAGLPFIGPETTARKGAEYPFDIATRTYQAGLDAANEEKKQIGAAARDLTTVNLPDANGNLIERQVTRAQAIDIAHGLPVPELGFKGMYGPGVGKPVLTPGQQAADTEMAQTSVKDYRAANDAARLANGRIQQYGQMAQAAQGFTSGPNAERWYVLKSQLKDLGWIKGTDVPDMEVFQNAARKMQVIAAPKGQGGVSNFERELFAATVPQIVNSPEGLAKAIDIARRLDEYDVKVAGIHRDVAQSNRGRPDSLAADARIAALGPPITPEEMQALDALRSPGGAAPAARPPTTTAPAASGAPPIGTVRDGYSFKGGNPADPNSWQKAP